MRWRFRPSTEPPRHLQLLLSLFTPPDHRAVLLSDLQDEYEERVLAEGTTRARRAYREQVLGSLAPGFRWRLSRLGAARRAGRRVPARWRPEPAIPTDAFNRGETMSDFWNDFRVGYRGLAKSPQVFVSAVVSLAIGIAATTTVFSMLNAFLLRSPATELPDDLVAIFTSADDGPHGDSSYPDFLDIRDGVEAIDGAFLHRVGGVELEDQAGRKRLLVELVAGDYFELTKLEMTLGRGFTAEETPMGSAERLVVLSHELWSRRFGSDRDVLGKTVRLDGNPYTVVGVGPEGYLSQFLGLRIDAWLPMGVPGGVYHATPSALADRGDRQYRIMARLAPGASLAQVRSQLDVVAERLGAAYPEDWADDRGQPRQLTVLSEKEARLPAEMRMAMAGLFATLLTATGVILLIACSNVACLFLARAHQRRREMALRLAIGAGRGRLVRMLMAESLLPALLAGVLGAALAGWAASAVSTLRLPFGVPLRFDFHLDLTVFLFAFLVSVAASVLFGLLPALEAAAPDLVSSLKADAGSGGRRPRRFGLRRILVAGQVATALVLVVGAGLSLRAFGKVSPAASGLDVERTAVMSRNLPEELFGPEAAGRYLEDLVERLRRRPDVEDAHVAISAEMSFLGNVYRAEVEAEGYERGKDESTFSSYNSVTPGYLEMLGVTLLRGRLLDAGDRPGAPPAAVVSKAFADRFWPGEQGIGRRFKIGRLESGGVPGQTYEVVGVVADGHFRDLTSSDQLFFWTSLPQQGWRNRVMLHVRGKDSAADALRALHDEVELAPGEWALVQPTAYPDLLSFELVLPRGVARLVGLGGLFGVLLALVGIYGVVSFTATMRRREMAVRQALGARPDQVVRAVVNEGTRLALWGIVLGVAAVVPVAGLLRNLLFGVDPIDPMTIAGGAAMMLAAAVLASWVPARRLASVQPMNGLREE